MFVVVANQVFYDVFDPDIFGCQGADNCNISEGRKGCTVDIPGVS